jgi:hypothetical protein
MAHTVTALPEVSRRALPVSYADASTTPATCAADYDYFPNGLRNERTR